MGNAVKNKINPHFKSSYANLEALRDVADSVLEKYGLEVENELVYTKADGCILYTNLVHVESGQWKNYSQMPICPAKPNDPQAFGSYMTYAERYAYKLVTGINVSDKTDDDGERANNSQSSKSRDTINPYARPESYPRLGKEEPILKEPAISMGQAADITTALSALLNGGKSLEAWLLKKAEVATIADLPASNYDWAMSVIAKAKERDGNTEKN
jgi:hypothetical protein